MQETIEMKIQQALNLAKEAGFSEMAPLDVSTIDLMPEVRDMCASNSCGMYGLNWACPPSCGSLEECRQNVSAFSYGILVQTIGEIEDSMDFEGMMEAEAIHKESFLSAAEKLRDLFPDLLPLGTGCCTICAKCSAPDAPCRFPQKRISSMEAYGLLVNDVCTKNGMKYYYGPGKIAYTACYLLF